MMSVIRPVFFISDGTGLTAEGLGQALLSQFNTVQFDKTTLPYIDSVEKSKKSSNRDQCGRGRTPSNTDRFRHDCESGSP